MANYISALTGAQMDDALQQMNNRVPEGWAVGERDGVPVGEESLYYHNNAKYYAEQAQAQAESAEESAESASQVAQETADAVIAQAFVQESAEVGSIVTIDDGADNIPLKDLKVNLAINQPLHGQANPYPAGGGKNLLDYDTVYSTYKTGENTFTGTAGQFALIQYNIPSELVGQTLTFSFKCTAFESGLNRIYAHASVNGSSVNGANISAAGQSSAVTFTPTSTSDYFDILYGTGANVAVTLCDFQLEISSAKTDWAPYSNICPIYPVTEVEVSRTGKNLLKFNATDISETKNGITASYSADTDIISITGTSTSANAFSILTHSIASMIGSLDVGERYTLSAHIPEKVYLQINSTVNGVTSRIANISSTNPYSSFTIPNGLENLQLFIGINGSAGTLNATVSQIQLERGSTATAYEPYAGQQHLVNIGINQFDKSTAVANSRWHNTGAINANGTTRSALIPVLPNTAYYFKDIHGLGVMNGVFWYDKDNVFIVSTGTGASSPVSGVFTSPSNAAYVGINFPSASLDTAGVNYPSRFTSYYPYTGNVVYGGELDVTTGVLTDEFSKKVTFTGTENWLLDTQYHNRYSAFYVAQNTLARMTDYRGSIVASNMMTIQRAGAAFDSQVNTIAITGYSNSPSSPTNYLYIIVDNQAEGYEGITTAAALKTWLGNNNVEVAFRVQTPLTIQLTPTEVDTLRGDNVIFCDAGDITNCEYRADLKLYIDKVVG